ncbi:MAG: glutaredoxin family protein [Coriobacteriales bacterium]
MKLELFKKDSCPYCQKVMALVDELGVGEQVEYRDIVRDSQARQTLVEVGGKQQVPCLFIDGEPLYESADIMRWMRENL